MEKHIIDIGKLSDKKNILKLLYNYELIIFDLDDTIFPLIYYDKIIFKKFQKLSAKNQKLINTNYTIF